MFKKLTAVLALALTLGGCATAYQSKGVTGGFSETVLSNDTFKINFSGNGFTSAERASDFAMLRAADKSLELGCNYFGIVSEAESASVGSMTFGSATWGRGGAWGFSSTAPIVKPNSNLMVKCFQSQPPQGNTFDAHFIAQSIRAKYAIVSVAGRVPTSVVAPANKQSPHGSSALPPSVQPTTDMATIVLAAQQVAHQQGCDDVHSSGATTFEASCGATNIVIECNGASCHPIRMVNK